MNHFNLFIRSQNHTHGNDIKWSINEIACNSLSTKKDLATHLAPQRYFR